MRAVCWHAPRDVRVESVPDPEILNPRDAIVRVRATAICGSDLHLYNGLIPTMQAGDILGHEFIGEVMEVGPGVRSLDRGARVVVPFAIACGACLPCSRDLTSLCDNSNPNAGMTEALYGFSGGGLFGYSHLYGGYAGGQAELVRVPFADVGPIAVPETLTDEQVLFLSDIFPTGYMAAEQCGIQPGDVVAVWGCGPVGQFAIQSAYLLGAERVIAIDRWPARLRLAETAGKAETMNYEATADVVEELKQRTGGRGPDACIDAVGTEAHGTSLDAHYDRVKLAVRLGTDRAHVLREAIQACRKGGDRVDSRRLRRLSRPGSVRRRLCEGIDLPHGTDARPPIPAPAPRADHRGAHRSPLRRQSPPAAVRSARGLPDVQQQGQRLHQGRARSCNASKFALVGLSEGLRAELAKDGIVVTTICPGLVRTGSPRHAIFKGRHRAEYAWFSVSDALPLVSMDADRAARQIVESIRRGEAERVLSAPASIVAVARALVPELTARLLAGVNRLLPPGDGAAGRHGRKGEASTSAVSPSVLTVLGDRAARRNNQVPGVL